MVIKIDKCDTIPIMYDGIDGPHIYVPSIHGLKPYKKYVGHAYKTLICAGLWNARVDVICESVNRPHI